MVRFVEDGIVLAPSSAIIWRAVRKVRYKKSFYKVRLASGETKYYCTETAQISVPTNLADHSLWAVRHGDHWELFQKRPVKIEHRRKALCLWVLKRKSKRIPDRLLVEVIYTDGYRHIYTPKVYHLSDGRIQTTVPLRRKDIEYIEVLNKDCEVNFAISEYTERWCVLFLPKDIVEHLGRPKVVEIAAIRL